MKNLKVSLFSLLALLLAAPAVSQAFEGDFGAHASFDRGGWRGDRGGDRGGWRGPGRGGDWGRGPGRGGDWDRGPGRGPGRPGPGFPGFPGNPGFPGRPGFPMGRWHLLGQCMPGANCYPFGNAIVAQPCNNIGQYASGYDGRGNYFNLVCVAQ